ncbi:MAG: metal-dependent hydrolase, partial [Candidatus Helarchaeota archaeon]
LQVYFRINKTISREKRTQHHAFPGHYPLLYSPVGFFLVVSSFFPMFIPFQLSIAVNVALLSHFLLDTICVPDGIKWLWPKSQRQIRFLTPRNLRDKHGDAYMWEYPKTYIDSPCYLQYFICYQ